MGEPAPRSLPENGLTPHALGAARWSWSPRARSPGAYGQLLGLPSQLKSGQGLSSVCRPSQSAWDAAECPAGSRDGRLLKDFAVPTGTPREVMEPPGKRSGPASQSRAIGVAAWRTGGRPGEVPGTVASSRQWGQGRPSVTRQGCLRQAEPAFLTGALCPP